MLTVIKVLIPTQGNREHPGNFQNKSVSSPFNWVSRHILFLPKLKGRGSPFLRGDHIMGLSPRVLVCCHERRKVSPFVKLEIILPLFCFLLDPLLKSKHCRAWSSIINLWIDLRTYQKKKFLLTARQMSWA